MPSKKSQITLFIIIGLIILISILFAVGIIKMRLEKKEPIISPEVQPVKIFIEKCIEDVSLPGILLLGVQGGYIIPPNVSLVTDYAEIGYGYYLGRNTLAAREIMEQQLSSYINSKLLVCINNFSSFSGRNITFKEPSAQARILDDKLIVDAAFPVYLENAKIEKFSAEIPVRLGHIHNIAQEIIAKEVQDPDWIDLGYLINFDVKVNIIPQDRENIVYSLSEGGFIFMFANKMPINAPPKLFLKDTYFVYDNVPWEFQVKYEDEGNVTFTDDTPMFDITPDGRIAFTPTVKGDFDVKITATDMHGDAASANVLFKVRG